MSKTSKKTPEKLLDAVRRGRKFLLTSHVNPDGDAIGSELGLARILHLMGKEAAVWNRDPAPRSYRHLVGVGDIVSGAQPPAGFPHDFDGVLVLECPSLERCGHPEALEGLALYNVDHHLGNESYGAVDWVDPSRAAVGCMVYQMAVDLGAEIDADAATALYLALFTDTGGFRFPNADADAFDTAAALVRLGAQPALVAQWLYESQPVAALRLVAEALSTLTLHDGGRVATVRLERAMLERTGAEPGDSEGLIDYPRSIAGVEAVALLREVEGDRVKVSLRSRGEVDVERVARAHGGGGHKNAAGFTLPDPEEIRGVESRVASALVDAISAATADTASDATAGTAADTAPPRRESALHD